VGRAALGNIRSCQRLRHIEEMAGQQCFYAGRKLGRSGFLIAHSLIERGKFRAQVDDANINELAAEFSCTVLRSSHEPSAKTGALHSWTYRKQPEIAAITARFYIDAAGLICDEELPLLQKFQHLIEIDWVVFDEESLNSERLIDDCDQTRGIILPSTANVHRNILCSEQIAPWLGTAAAWTPFTLELPVATPGPPPPPAGAGVRFAFLRPSVAPKRLRRRPGPLFLTPPPLRSRRPTVDGRGDSVPKPSPKSPSKK
jgi:hypothetical protein